MTFTAPRAGLSAAILALLILLLAALPSPVLADGGGSGTTCSTVTNPLGAATGYTEFIAGNGQRGSESEGAIAYGGNLVPGWMPVGSHLPPDPDAPTLVVAGTHGTFNLQQGSAYLNPPSGVNFNGGGHYLASNPIDFTAAFTDLRATSTAWGGAAANGTATIADSQTLGKTLGGSRMVLYLHGTDTQLNVFSVTPAQLTGYQGIFIDTPASSTTLINVSGTSVTIAPEEGTWFKVGSTYEQASDATMATRAGTLWNFPTATSVTIDKRTFGGTILAPNASVAVVGGVGHTIGQVIAASFSSDRETHQRLFPSSACLPGGDTPPPPATDVDVSITKTVSTAKPRGGDTVTYTLAVKNAGPGTAEDVVVRDALPLGVTFVSASAPCHQAAGIVSCDLGDLASGATRTLTITVQVNRIAAVSFGHRGSPAHNLTVSKAERQVDLDPGETKTVTLSCPSGIVGDGSIRTDAVDQDTGTLADVRVLSARSTGVSEWQAVVRNDASGRAQAKAFVLCLPARTEPAAGHRHALRVSAPVTTTRALGVGRHSVTLNCARGSSPIVPGYELAGGAATLVGSERVSGGWTFTLDVTQPTTATLSLRCLSDRVATADGHRHWLKLQHVVRTVTVPAGQVVEGQVICADDAKGIVATWMLPTGLVPLGNDPRPKTRAFRLYNPTTGPLTATIDLECLRDRTGRGHVRVVTPKTTIANTASVQTSSTDTDPANDHSTATITVKRNR